VGKTTTIAKLAAHFSLVEKRRVGLLTMDTYRIAAVEQLKTYSQIIDIPVQVAYNQSDVVPALRTFENCDLVLIDTAGRSQKNVMQVSELKTLIDMADCETHLVLSASTKERDLCDQVERFLGVGVDRLLFTKLDETTSYGTIYSLAAKYDLPVSYITTGQKVPEDIEVADGTKLAAIVMNSAPRI
jgi:flagellar biosynthesis protein FlhF